ncbi:L,D-transpeptidase catalytic domain [compost metagenome]|uniref:L,D-transpeptidase catalytic domain n=1 Tax=Pseudomonas linyingensis TaxID=915471 RepID=A0A1H6UQW2_9PSED|nr:murein L,D-transpeptidase catalytic domain family protein [Pseudomonas linyingensis]SEI92097.1 L,D-transpeptidase catalytic domain [Pseudomonas linyingensis]
MTRLIRSLWLAAGLAAFSSSLLANTPRTPALIDSLAKAAPTLNREVLRHALAAMQCAINNGSQPAERLAVIDFSLPSTQRRLWIFDLSSKRLLLRELVAHGQGSGENFATSFSNREGSHQSSIGLFRTSETYHGQHGYSLRMDGLEPGINDRARERAIVIHPADYVNPAWIKRHGRIGRSHGCPAVRPQVARMVVDSLKGGQFMFSWYPDQKWMRSSAYLNCKPQRVASILAASKDSES